MLTARIGAPGEALHGPQDRSVRRLPPDPAARPPSAEATPSGAAPPNGGGPPLRLALPDPGFIAHMLADQSALDEPPGPLFSGLDAYRLQIGARISYSGPVRPVDLWI